MTKGTKCLRPSISISASLPLMLVTFIAFCEFIPSRRDGITGNTAPHEPTKRGGSADPVAARRDELWRRKPRSRRVQRNTRRTQRARRSRVRLQIERQQRLDLETYAASSCPLCSSGV